ncbi:MAG: glucose-6-phosphate isomerase [Firmicutes bacterium]|nr:glucose-6-phosphate isomerase [Bacillota bacterium]
MGITLKENGLHGFITEEELLKQDAQAQQCAAWLNDGQAAGSDFLGWVDLPVNYDREEYERIKKAAKKIQGQCDVFLVIGIGGSYLGARAALEFIQSPIYNNLKKDTPDIYFIGNSISSRALAEVMSLIEGRDFAINVISKSGTTTEPAIAFRLLKDRLEERYGKEGAKERIYATTDQARGTLKQLSDREGYETFVIADDIGGRYSVLTAVGLLPMAVCGIDIDAVMQGAADAREKYQGGTVADNDCLRYAAIRHCLMNKRRDVEILVNYEPALVMFGEWYKQLFAESHGKDKKGIFPVSANFSTDLHSIGQYIQDGADILFETVLWIENSKHDILIEEEAENMDGLNFLAGKSMQYVNSKAFQGTLLAHVDGNVPNIVLEIPEADAYHFGYLVYFFEKACGVGGYMLNVNPFDQPGVESYKKNMFALLGKPGYEEMKDALEQRLL